MKQSKKTFVLTYYGVPVLKCEYVTPSIFGKRLANLRPFSSEYQPRNRGSRKGIPNRSTILRLWMEEFDKREKRKAAKGCVRCPSCGFKFKPKSRKKPKAQDDWWPSL